MERLAARLSRAVRAAVRCPWEIKGRIMRELTKQTDDYPKRELVDGIKVYNNGAWALVLPDASEPFFHIYAEGPSADEAQTMLNDYVGRVESLRG